eukprot:31314-Pelagococcus_subviridis.AAC.21
MAQPRADAVAAEERQESNAPVVARDRDPLRLAVRRSRLRGHRPHGAAVRVRRAPRPQRAQIPLRDDAVEARGEEAARHVVRGRRVVRVDPVPDERRDPGQARDRGAFFPGHARDASPVRGVVDFQVPRFPRERDCAPAGGDRDRDDGRGLPLHEPASMQLEAASRAAAHRARSGPLLHGAARGRVEPGGGGGEKNSAQKKCSSRGRGRTCRTRR